MNAMAEQRARAEQAKAIINGGVARIVRKKLLDGGDLVEIFGEMRLHQHCWKLGQECAKFCELLVGRGDGKAWRHRIALPALAVPALDQVAAVGNGGAGGRQQRRRAVAVHRRIAGDHAGIPFVRGRKQSLRGAAVRAAISDRRGGAVACHFVEEEFGIARGMRRIGEFLLLDEGVFLQPFEQLRAVGCDHLGLRIMDVRVDEARHDQEIGKMLDRKSGRKLRRQLRCRPRRFYLPVFSEDNAIHDIAIALRIAGAARRAQERQQPATDRAQISAPIAGLTSDHHGAGAPAASHDASVRRSSGVISVMLPGGMASERTAAAAISGACKRMCSSVSSKRPFGGAASPAQTGSAAWHMAQRDITIVLTSANLGVGGSAPTVTLRGPAPESQATAAMPAAATPQVHHGVPFPSWRELKKWRITGPMASTMATISQLKRVA